MEFLDRQNEFSRLNRCLDGGKLVVVVGRRRIGKTRLILQWLDTTAGLYFVADRSASAVQRRYFANTIANRFPGFEEVEYRDWRGMLDRLSREAAAHDWHGPLVIDELPYLAESDPSIAAVLQHWVDDQKRIDGITLVLMGSSRRMMHSLAVDEAAPLFGRSDQLINLGPLPVSLLGRALGTDDPVVVAKGYAVWGGVPRYWEIAEPFGEDIDHGLDDAVLDPLGPLHTEIDRLLLDETPPALSLRPILDAIGGGAHRISEIAGRVGRPATSLSHAIDRLVDLGLVERVTPFGVPARSTKRSLYVISDPFARMWFTVVAPHKSVLAEGSPESRLTLWERYRDTIYSIGWEDLCRRSVAKLSGTADAILGQNAWEPAGRYWHGNDPEFDIVSVSNDRSQVLLGEAKWSESPRDLQFLHRTFRTLSAKGVPPNLKATTPEYAVFVPKVNATPAQIQSLPFRVVTARDVVGAL
jgi:hypothetical protein